MPSLDSDKVERALKRKLKDQVEKSTNDKFYLICNASGNEIASTSISHGPKHSLSSKRISVMARQLCLETADNLADLVRCSLSGEDALTIIEKNCDPDAPQRRR